MSETHLFWAAALVFVLCGGVIAAWRPRPGRREAQGGEAQRLLLALICLVSGTAHAALASGIGRLQLRDGAPLELMRYLDWAVTTPLLLLALALTAMSGRPRRWGLLAMLVGLDLLMILSGLFSALLPEARLGAKLTWFVVSELYFVAVMWCLWAPLRHEAERSGHRPAAFYVRQAVVLTALWLLYPLAFIAGPLGMAWLGEGGARLALGVIDLAAKAGLGLAMAGVIPGLTGRRRGPPPLAGGRPSADGGATEGMRRRAA